MVSPQNNGAFCQRATFNGNILQLTVNNLSSG